MVKVERNELDDPTPLSDGLPDYARQRLEAQTDFLVERGFDRGECMAAAEETLRTDKPVVVVSRGHVATS